MTPLRVALIGAGAMARRHAMVVGAAPDARLEVVIDDVASRARQLAFDFDTRSTCDLAAAARCDLAIVANATSGHHRVALQLIESRIPVLIEKPLASTLVEARELVDAAARLDGVLMCGFVERFNDQLAPVTERSGERPDTIRSFRLSPPPLRMHSDVVDDVLLHDLDLVLRIVGNDPVTAIDVDASSWVPGRLGPEAVRCQLAFSGGTEVDMQASRVADRRERRLCATFGSASISVDLLNARNNALAAQLQHLIELVRAGTASTRATERESLLPAHELARRIGELIQVSTCGR